MRLRYACNTLECVTAVTRAMNIRSTHISSDINGCLGIALQEVGTEFLSLSAQTGKITLLARTGDS
jgi:hypothetical protein